MAGAKQAQIGVSAGNAKKCVVQSKRAGGVRGKCHGTHDDERGQCR